MWPAQPVTDAGALAVAARWERLRRPSQLAQCGPDGDWLAPDWPALGQGPVLLLLHDTFSTPQSTFADWVGDASFAPVLQALRRPMPGVRASHAGSGLDENVAWLCRRLRICPGPSTSWRWDEADCWRARIAADGRLALAAGVPGGHA